MAGKFKVFGDKAGQCNKTPQKETARMTDIVRVLCESGPAALHPKANKRCVIMVGRVGLEPTTTEL